MLRALRVFSHWLTPVGAPRRYDTWFFVARSPDGQDGVHDDGELVASAWLRPMDALRRHARGDLELILPTMRCLEALARFPTVGSVASPRSIVCRVTTSTARSSSRMPEASASSLPGDDAARAPTVDDSSPRPRHPRRGPARGRRSVIGEGRGTGRGSASPHCPVCRARCRRSSGEWWRRIRAS